MIKFSIDLKYNSDNLTDAFNVIHLLSEFINNTDDLFIEDFYATVIEDNQESGRK